MRAPLAVDHGYLVAELGGVRALVDTGSHVSFGNAPEVVVDGVVHPLVPSALPVSIEELRRLSGADFDVLLGTDVLKHHPFTLNTAQGEIVFGELPAGGYAQPVDLFRGSPLLTVGVAGQEVPCILDTGANVALLPPGTRWPVPACGEREDFVPMFGQFRTPLRRCRARVLGHDLEMEFGELPAVMELMFQRTPVRGLVGVELLATGRVGIDLGRRLVVYEPRH